jgi:hypothetical protein
MIWTVGTYQCTYQRSRSPLPASSSDGGLSTQYPLSCRICIRPPSSALSAVESVLIGPIGT